MSNNYKSISIILIALLLGLLLIFGLTSIFNKNRQLTILVGDNTIWNYSDKDWLNITNDNTIASINWLEYTVYLDNKYFGEYSMWYDDNKWYAFNPDKSAVLLDGELLAYRSNFDLNIKEFETKEITNNTYVHQVLKENNLSTSSKLTVNNVVSSDIDNDGINEDIYVISNAFALDFYPDTIFSIVFMVKEETIYPMYTDIDKRTNTDGCKPYIRAILDADDDKTDEVIVTCAQYSVQEPVDMLYKFNKKKFELIISNQ